MGYSDRKAMQKKRPFVERKRGTSNARSGWLVLALLSVPAASGLARSDCRREDDKDFVCNSFPGSVPCRAQRKVLLESRMRKTFIYNGMKGKYRLLKYQRKHIILSWFCALEKLLKGIGLGRRRGLTVHSIDWKMKNYGKWTTAERRMKSRKTLSALLFSGRRLPPTTSKNWLAFAKSQTSCFNQVYPMQIFAWTGWKKWNCLGPLEYLSAGHAKIRKRQFIRSDSEIFALIPKNQKTCLR